MKGVTVAGPLPMTAMLLSTRSTPSHWAYELANKSSGLGFRGASSRLRPFLNGAYGTGKSTVLTKAENMAAVWGNYLRDGPRQLVVAGVIASGRDWERYEETFALPVRSVRLVASAASTEAGLRRRYREQQSSSLTWHLERHLNLTDRLAAHELDEPVIDTEAVDPHGVAVSILDHFGLG